MKNRSVLSEQEIDLLRRIGLDFDYSKKLTDEEAVMLEERVGDYLTLECLDEDYNPNRDGLICYDILEKVDWL